MNKNELELIAKQYELDKKACEEESKTINEKRLLITKAMQCYVEIISKLNETYSLLEEYKDKYINNEKIENESELQINVQRTFEETIQETRELFQKTIGNMAEQLGSYSVLMRYTNFNN